MTEKFRRFDFDWEVLDVILSGRSAIDSAAHLNIRSVDDALRFLDCYGYDLDNPIEKAELFGNFQEALNLIRKYFLQPANPDGLKLEIPRKITEITEISQLLILSAPTKSPSPSNTLASLWACSIIKVMHTISHIDKDLRTNYFTDIQKQILDRFYKFIFSNDKGSLYLGKDDRDESRIELVNFSSKPKKARESVILKLLHKSENVAEELFDRVGIRFVTKDRFDALKVAKFLRDRYIVMPANLKPSRSRNTLIDVGLVKDIINKSSQEMFEDPKKAEAFELELKQTVNSTTSILTDLTEENPHSSDEYQSIQFTGRQLIKIQNPLYADLRAVKNLSKTEKLPESVLKIVERIDLRNIQREIKFFYPFEVQILDAAAFRESEAGQSSHANYKKSQISAAMKRVMGELVRFKDASN